MKPFLLFLRIAMVCVLVFFVYSAIRKSRNILATDRLNEQAAQRTQPTPQPQRSSRAETVPGPNLPNPTPLPAKASATPIPEYHEGEIAPREPSPPHLTPASETDGDFTLTMKLCKRQGETIQCSGSIVNNGELPIELEAGRDQVIDDLGHNVQANHLFDGKYARVKLVPGVPVIVGVGIADPYPSVKTVFIETQFLYYPNGMFNIQRRSFRFKDFPVQ
jgi:hypothetical protein